MSKRQKKPQAQKVRNEAYAKGMQQIKHGNAAGPHKPKNAYQRKPKHFKGWD